MIHLHRLDGCAPAPLAHYLKGLGILRLIAEQADAEVRAWWEGDHFRLATTLAREQVERFFLYDYRPTPLVSPWNKGAGFFFPNDPALSPLEHSTSRRFAGFRTGISASRLQLDDLSRADKEVRDIKAETKMRGMSRSERDRLRDSEDYKSRLREADKRFKRLKADLIPNLRLNWRGPHREWMDAAMVLEDDGKPRYPALLGSGGNDGRLDFTNNFMRRLGEVFDLASVDGRPRDAAPSWLAGALWGVPIPGNLAAQPVGQYLPGTAGGANNSNGPESDSLVNPVDFILMLEGAIAFASHATRRLGSRDSSRAASPFAVNACGAAYSSASASDESAAGEQWMPLWSNPSTFAELKRLLAEGRAQVGAQAVREPLDLARAVARLGTARGVRAFQRYGYIERNGQTNLAVPLGRFHVADQQFEQLACLDDLDPWLSRLRRESRTRHAPARLAIAEKRLIDALFTATEHASETECWQRVLQQLAGVEAIMARGSGYGAGPIPRLRPAWVTAADDGTPEFRLAVAFALQAHGFRRDDKTPVDSVRRHWLPLERKRRSRFATSGTGASSRLDVPSEVVMRGRRGLDDAIALVERRLIETAQRGGRHLPLKAAPRAAAHEADLVGLLAGRVDVDRSLAMARALMAIDRRAWADQPITMASPRASLWPDDAWLAIRLCMLPWPLDARSGSAIDIGADPAILRRLVAGDAGSAIDLALRRLPAAGIRCTLRTGTVPPYIAQLWAAALAFPITQGTARRFLSHLDPNQE